MTEGMLGRNNETMREEGWRTDEGDAWLGQRPHGSDRRCRNSYQATLHLTTAAEESETGNMGGVRHGAGEEPRFKRRSVRQGRSPSPGPDVGVEK